MEQKYKPSSEIPELPVKHDLIAPDAAITGPSRAAAQGRLESLVTRRTCAWSENDDGVYETECGNAFELNDGAPADNNMAYCCYCGRLLDTV